MVKIRLKRTGAKKAPAYRFVVSDGRSPRDGRFIAEIGYYNPTVDPAVIVVEEEQALHWLERGAQPTETVRSLFRRVGILAKLAERKKA